MPAYGAPGRPGAGERLVHKLSCRVLVADADQDSPQALIGGAAVELREVQLLVSYTHTHPTHHRHIPITCRPAETPPLCPYSGSFDPRSFQRRASGDRG